MPIRICECGSCELPVSKEINESMCSICCIDCNEDECPLKEIP